MGAHTFAPPVMPDALPVQLAALGAVASRGIGSNVHSQRTRDRVKRTHRAARRVDANIVGDGGTDDDDAIGNNRRRCVLDLGACEYPVPIILGKGSSVTTPCAEAGQGLPVSASSAISLRSFVTMKMRDEQAACAVPDAPKRDAAANEAVADSECAGLSFGSKRQICLPVPGSIALTSSNGEQTNSFPSARIGVSSNDALH